MQYQQRHHPPQPKYRFRLRHHSISLCLDNSSRFIAHPSMDRQGLYQNQRNFPKYTARLAANNIFLWDDPNLDLR